MDDQSLHFELTEPEFLALLVKHEPALRAYARSLVPDWDLVDEALQEASVTMWQKRGQLESDDGFVLWARVILRFKCLRQLEKLRLRRPLLSEAMLETLAKRGESRSVEDGTARGRALHTCLEQFSAEHRELLLAPHSSTHTVVELAQRRNKSTNSLYKLLGRLRDPVHATPSVVNSHVYFGTATAPAFYKLNPDGTSAWVYQLDSGNTQSKRLPSGGLNLIDAENGVVTSALVTHDAVHFGDTSGVFYALDRVTGREKWKVDTRAEGFPGHHPINIFNASAIPADGKVIVGGGGYEHPYPLDPNYECCTGRGFVVAFDPHAGDVVWKYDVGEEPQRFPEAIAITDDNGKHIYKFGPSTSSVWSTPSYGEETKTVFFGTDVNNSPRKPTADNPRLDSKYSAAVIAVDVNTGKEKWVRQLHEGDIFNHTMSGYDSGTTRYKDCSVGDTPKIYSIQRGSTRRNVVGVGCKNGCFYVLDASHGDIIAQTPMYQGRPQYPLKPKPDLRMIALPSVIGGIQTGCGFDGRSVFTNGIDWVTLNTRAPLSPEGGRVVCLADDLSQEKWRHERPRIDVPQYTGGDPVGSGIALAGGIAAFTTTVSERLVILDAASGKTLKEIRVGTVWSGPSISRGRVYVGTGSILFLKKELEGSVRCYGLPGKKVEPGP